MKKQPELIVACKENCGNAPKKQLLKDFTIALAKKDRAFPLDYVRDDIVWDIVGKQQIEGISEYEKALEDMQEREGKELHIDNIITHGNTASVNGTFILHTNETIAFCDVYHFGSFGKKAKIKKITSYVIKTS